MGDHDRVSGAVCSDANGWRPALLAQELLRPWRIHAFLRGNEHPLKVPIALSPAEIPKRALNLPTGPLCEGDPLRAVGQEGLDPSAGISGREAEDQEEETLGLVIGEKRHDGGA